MTFAKKIFFFLAGKIMLIHRFPHSFGVWECWGGSKSAHFAFSRGFRCPELVSAALLTEACPSMDFGENIISFFCRFTREYSDVLRSEIDSIAMQTHSAMSFNHLTVSYMIIFTCNKDIPPQNFPVSRF